MLQPSSQTEGTTTHSMLPQCPAEHAKAFPEAKDGRWVVCLTSRAALGRGASPGAVAWASGKLRRVAGPLMARAALSYSLAASSAVSKVPSHRRTFLVVSRISAAYFPQGLNLTPRYLKMQQCNAVDVHKQSLIMMSLLNVCARDCSLVDKLRVVDLHCQQPMHATRAPKHAIPNLE